MNNDMNQKLTEHGPYCFSVCMLVWLVSSVVCDCVAQWTSLCIFAKLS